MIWPAGTSRRRQYSANRSACPALPNASDHHARNDRASSAAVRCASMMSCSQYSSARSRSDATMTSSEINRAARNARSNSGVRLTSTIARSACGCRLLDLRKTVRRRQIDAGDETEIENQKPAIRLRRQQRLDVLIEPIGRTEEQIALQRHALNLPAVIGQQRQLVRPAVERGAVFRSVEIEFDRVHAACAQREGGATDHDADQDAGDETRINDQDGDRDQRQIFEQQQAPRRLNQPLIDQVGAEIEQKPAENIFRHIAEERRIGDQHAPPRSPPRSCPRYGWWLRRYGPGWSG